MNTFKKRQPLLFNAVLEAIANLNESKGSTLKTITDQVNTALTINKKPSNRSALSIGKALKHGVNMGLIKQKNRKYKLGLETKDYAIYKNFQRMIQSEDMTRKHRRRRRSRKSRSRSGRRGGRRRRKHSEASDSEDFHSEAGTSLSRDFIGSVPEDRGGRRRKRSRKRRRSGRRHNHSNNSRKSENLRIGNEKDQSQDEKDGRHYPNCDNPECLCNINGKDTNIHDNT